MRKDARIHSASPPVGAPTEPVAADDFVAGVHAWAERLDARPAEVHIAGMRRKWASCSARGRVTFDVELLAQPESFRGEVIVHELLHLRVPNHEPLFRALLQTHLAALPSAKADDPC